jgi:hypothetical protein
VVWQHICKRIVQHESVGIILFNILKVIESLYQNVSVLIVCLCTLFLVQGRRLTGYCEREGVFVMFASSKRGLVSLISCSEINSFCRIV